jgi:hypothetical protein
VAFLVVSNLDDAMHVLLTALAAILMLVSLNAYRKRPDGRYALLAAAFVLLFLDQAVTLYQEVYFNGQLLEVPFVPLHLVHFIELIMILCFIAALLVKPSSGPTS